MKIKNIWMYSCWVFVVGIFLVMVPEIHAAQKAPTSGSAKLVSPDKFIGQATRGLNSYAIAFKGATDKAAAITALDSMNQEFFGVPKPKDTFDTSGKNVAAESSFLSFLKAIVGKTGLLKNILENYKAKKVEEDAVRQQIKQFITTLDGFHNKVGNFLPEQYRKTVDVLRTLAADGSYLVYKPEWDTIAVKSTAASKPATRTPGGKPKADAPTKADSDEANLPPDPNLPRGDDATTWPQRYHAELERWKKEVEGPLKECEDQAKLPLSDEGKAAIEGVLKVIEEQVKKFSVFNTSFKTPLKSKDLKIAQQKLVAANLGTSALQDTFRNETTDAVAKIRDLLKQKRGGTTAKAARVASTKK